MFQPSVIKYLNRLYESDTNDSIHQKIADFFKKFPKPEDEQIHSFADSEGIDKHKFEEIVYELLGSFLGEGKSKNFTGSYDPSQIEMGIKVESEHTSSQFIAERIAKDHLSEFPDYYTRLAKMEKEAEASKNEKS